ncbi:MAG: hypothetical protein JW829_09885 [Pirellulales bacterium]|nr:hypothetical protein [Pirellulales bacterium]
MQELRMEEIHVAMTDLVIVVVYLVLIFIAGIVVTRIASKNLNSYFLGDRKLPWWLLGLSGTACYFDVAGVMWTITLFYVMGQRFIWPQLMWGCVVMLACFATFMGKWLQRSRVLTGAEWMIVRFGNGAGGEFARVAYALMAIVIAVAFIGFAEFGCGRFLLTFTPHETARAISDFIPAIEVQHVLAITLMAFTAVYAVAAGLIGVGITGFIQFLIVLVGSFVLISKAVNMSSFETLARQVPPDWFSIAPVWNWPRLEGWADTAGWIFFGPMLLMWCLKGFALGAGGPQQLYDLQRFLAARSPREASLAGMIWGIGLTPMFMVSAAVGVIGMIRWGGNLSNPDQLYPVVIGTMLPIGLKGIVLAGLIAAFMSTFSSTVNAGASYMTNDLYQKYVRRGATQAHYVWASRVCSILVVILGILIGMQAKNINQIFDWIMMELGAAVIIPNVLRWYWWRFNGVGFAVGTLAGTAAAIASALFFPAAPRYVGIPTLMAISVVTSIAAAWLSPPTDLETLQDFYRRVRPAGLWGPVRRIAESKYHDSKHQDKQDNFTLDLVATLVTMIGLQALYLISTYACTHQWHAFWIASGVVIGSAVALYFIWYRQLPEDSGNISF